MYDYVRATSGVAVLFFVSLVIFGNWILLNLFLAILLSNFQEDDRVDDEPEEPENSLLARLKRSLTRLLKKDGQGEPDSAQHEIRIADLDVEDQMPESVKPLAQPDQTERAPEELKPPSQEATRFRARRAINNMTLQMSTILEPGEKKESKEIVLVGKALYVLAPDNQIRIACKKIVGHKYFDPFILVMIVFSTVLLTLENPLDDPNGKKAAVLRVFDFVVSFIFVAEFLLKVLVFGFALNGKDSYIRSTWNQIDFLIVIFSVSLAFLLCADGFALCHRS